MIVGIYNGFFSPAEAAGMGVLATIVMMVGLGKFTWRKFFDAVSESVKLFTFMFVALMAAVMFASTIALSQLPQFIADWALAQVDSPLAILYMIIVIFIIAGFFLESFGMVMMLVPLFFPVMVQAGFDPVYFGVIIVMLMEVGLLTPPAAPNIYVTQYVGRGGRCDGSHQWHATLLRYRAGIDGAPGAFSDDCDVAAGDHVINTQPKEKN
ncbi:MAG: hypothetical protein CM1200mP41_29570 [Gammaproteobacteria bacterium]|nr:MAG: hypothetical protein CM1200mP41_29570 [Gammaproteobacteria bacterium]